MNASRRVLALGQRQLCCRSRVASRSATYWAASPNRATPSSTVPPAAPAATAAASGATQAATSKPEAAKSEPAKSEPAKSEPVKAEPAKAEPAKAEPAKAEPAKAEPAKAEPAKVEPAKAEPVKADPLRADPLKAVPAKYQPVKPAPAKPAPAKPAPAKPAAAPAKAATPNSKSFSTSSSSKASSSTAIPRDLFYKPTTVAHANSQGRSTTTTAAIPGVDWSLSFHGISSQPVTKAQFEALMKPLDVDDIEVKPDGIIYLPEIRYRRRLNEAFGPMGWGLIPKGDAVVGAAIVTREYALIVDGRFVSQAQGENSYFGADQLPSAVEGCKSNALMRCCKDLGIASELWDPSFIRWFKKNRMEEVWVEHTTTKKKRTLWYRKGAVDVAYPYRQTK
ncbi:hypothetical protein PWT90_08872 [Aphanocladium album]|nr:hypothetical protein PWT90_08872 [Aphanocladium album]